MKDVLIASADNDVLQSIGTMLRQTHAVIAVRDGNQCLKLFRSKRYEFTFVDIAVFRELMGENNCRSFSGILREFRHVFPTAKIVVLAPLEQTRHAVDVVRAGANNYLTYPVDPAELTYIMDSVEKADLLESEREYFRGTFWQEDSLELVQTKSAGMQLVLDRVMSVAPTKTTVLLTGETGTGKGVMAKLIHTHSSRKDGLFISVHCGAIPDGLVESELFGHEKGAFTGATRRKLGRFEIARGGTIFLDEIGTISPSLQIKLLNVMQEKTFQRVGGEETISCDVRVIAATNSDLKTLSDSGLFRKDLYYRLNVFPLELPPLRERVQDIPVLAGNILRRMNLLYNKNIKEIDPRVIDALQKYQWPGNIRELEHLFERAYILENSSVLTSESFPMELFAADDSVAAVPLDTAMSLSAARKKAQEEVEQQYLRQVLSECGGRIDHTAKAAGITTRQLHKLMKRYGIDKKDFKPVMAKK